MQDEDDSRNQMSEQQILSLMKNMRDKAANGCLSKLDQAILAKMQKVVMSNPKHYS
jgi:hypothetical protein